MRSLLAIGQLLWLIFRFLAAVRGLLTLLGLAGRVVGGVTSRVETTLNRLSEPGEVPVVVRARIDAIVGDLFFAPTEAIVISANTELSMGDGEARTLKRAAGEKVEREAMAQGPILGGEAVATSSGQLGAPIRWVIHSAVLGPDGQANEDLVRAATAGALALAAKIGAQSIAFPALGTGAAGLSMAVAARVMVSEATKAAEIVSSLDWIVFVLPDEGAWQLFLIEMAKSAKD